VKRYRAQAVNESLSRHLAGLDHAMQVNAAEMRDAMQALEAEQHLRALRAEAAAAKEDIAAAGTKKTPAPSSGPGF